MMRDEVTKAARDAGIVWIDGGTNVAPLIRFASLIASIERAKIWASVNALIKRGHLPGDGTDKTAERNGIILAANTIIERDHNETG